MFSSKKSLYELSISATYTRLVITGNMPCTSGGDWETHREPGVIDKGCNGYHDEEGGLLELAHPHSVRNSNIYNTTVSTVCRSLSLQYCMVLYSIILYVYHSMV